jgi:Flp pilus assembly protein TadD
MADPNLQADLLDRALDLMAAGAPEKAVPVLQEALAAAPENSAAAHALLRALEDSGQVADALALVRSLIASEPDDPLLHTRLSILLQMVGEVPGAEAASARARVLEWKRQLRGEPE